MSTLQFTSSSWLDEHDDIQVLLRNVRADLNNRDSLVKSTSSVPPAADVAAAHNANVQAKKKLAAVLARLSPLATGLQDLALGGMKDGEVRRRGDMVARMQDECNSLGKMVVAARQATSSTGGRTLLRANDDDALASDPNRTILIPGAFPSASRPTGRVFGQKPPPPETDQTRPLDAIGLVQLQQLQMDQQDQQLSQLTALLSRQKHLGLAIGAEIEAQNEMLDALSVEVDATAGRLAKVKGQMRTLK
jgi:regulator of vacuolar morphogenesis